MFATEPVFRRLKLSRPVAGQQEDLVKASIIAACMALCAAALSGCSQPVNCSGGGCVPGTASPAVFSPATATPLPAPGGEGPAAAGLGGVASGEPSDLADVDDRRCRSYGLVSGTRDYADCRIRLGAQHQGLAPNVGTTPASK